ncbi:DUF6916 family protein [Euzebya rosea]|uniref:DUF6916 family protein n=1 Tax=Euzebya rosea TaxID=2052804 RepID=UPI000D3E3820|nr:hypothetical protein [Euzebya rosea]
MTDPSEVTLATFAERTGQQVSVAEVEGLELEVLEAVERTVGPDGASGSAFSVLFAGPAGLDLPQSMVTLGDDVLDLPLFLVPIGPGADGRPRFEAVFTRLPA